MDSRVLYHECRSLAKRYRTVLVCRDDGPSREAEGVEIVTVPKARGRIARFLGRRELIRAAEALDAAVYHFHDPELMEPMLALGRRTAKPVVYDVHEDYPSAMDQKAWIPAPLRPVAASWADRTEHRCAPKYAAIVVADAALRERFVAARRGCRRAGQLPAARGSRRAAAAPRGPPTMVYVGSVSEMRGFHEMVGVLRGVHEVRRTRGSSSTAVLPRRSRPNSTRPSPRSPRAPSSSGARFPTAASGRRFPRPQSGSRCCVRTPSTRRTSR